MSMPKKLDITQIDENFKSEMIGDYSNLDVYSVLDPAFDLYGVSYDYDNKCFVRAPYDVAKSIAYGVEVLNTNTAGGRVRFSTNSTSISIIVKYRAITKMRHMPLTGSCGFTLIQNLAGNKYKYLKTYTPSFTNDIETSYEDWYTYVKEFDGKFRSFTLYFPCYQDFITDVYIAFDKGSKIKKGKPYKNFKPILYYGSSVTQGGCASRPDNAYQSLIEKKTNIDFLNLGYSGNGKARKQMVDYMKTVDCSVFVCDYDHNAPSVEYLQDTHYYLYSEFRSTHKDTPIILISATDERDYDNRLKRRDIIKETYLKAVANGDKNVYFIDGQKVIPVSEKQNAFVDGVHPNDLGFYYLAKAILKVLKKVVK